MTVTSDHSRVPADSVQAMSEQLDHLLAQQIVCLREGNLDGVEQIAVRADALVAGIVSHGAPGSVMTPSSKVRLKQRYEELALALRAERSDVQTKLRQLRQVKRAVGSYRQEEGRSRPTVLDDRAIQ